MDRHVDNSFDLLDKDYKSRYFDKFPSVLIEPHVYQVLRVNDSNLIVKHCMVYPVVPADRGWKAPSTTCNSPVFPLQLMQPSHAALHFI